MKTQPHAGKLEKVAVPQILRELYLSRATGILDLRQGRDQRRVVVDEGDIRSVRSNRMEQRIGQHALNNGIITRIELMQALSSRKEDVPLGQTLVQLGFFTTEELDRQLTDLARHIMNECIAWDSGEYRFQKGRAILPEDTEIRVSTGDIIFQGFHRHASERMARRMIGDLNSPLVPNPNLRLLFQHISLTESQRQILDRVDGNTGTAELVSTLPGDSEHNLVLLAAFVAAGLLSTKDRESRPSLLGLPTRNIGDADPASPPRPETAPTPSGPPRRSATAPSHQHTVRPPRRKAVTPQAEKSEIETARTESLRRHGGGDLSSPVSRAGTGYQPKKGLFKKKPTKKVGLKGPEIQRMRESIHDKYRTLDSADHYHLLGVPLRATQKEVYYAFNMLCTLFHPDLARKEEFSDLKPQLEAIFSRLEEAYETLVDASRRKRYDRSQKSW